MRGVVRVTPWAWVCSWMPRADGRCGWVPWRHSTCAGGLAAALGDAGFGTSARRGSLPSPALGVMRSRNQFRGIVYAPDEISAEAAAIAEFKVREDMRRRLIVRPTDE
jgi:hypothetical protein